MKWPERLTLVRHDSSAYNMLKEKKAQNSTYQQFRAEFQSDSGSPLVKELALEVQDIFSLGFGDHETPLAKEAGWQAKKVGEELKGKIPIPEAIFVSPYLRAHLTLQNMIEGWPELSDVKVIEEERIREQDHGLALLYSDWRVFHTLHPEQGELYKLQGPYWYKYPQGENVPDVRERLRSWLGTLTRDYRSQEVLAVTHHLTILSIRANLERLDAAEFNRLDEEEKPINCGVTVYKGDKNQGSSGQLKLDVYNLNLYDKKEIE